MSSPSMSSPPINPILVEVTRGPLVESVHRGAVAVSDADGRLALAYGDVLRPVFARSAIKLIQALPLVESGASARFGFGAAEIALACGSHVGSPRHVDVARSMLDRIGLDESCLACGAAEPIGTRAARALAASGGRATPLHHTCSGKHLGFLATAATLGPAPPASSPPSYAEPSHPVQRAIKAAVRDLSGYDITSATCGTDGCSVPTFAMPLSALARVFAHVADRSGLPRERATALETILNACWAEPELVAGPGRADTAVMAALPGRIYMKTGAEGVYCGALPEYGLGFALKIDDGAQRAAAAAVMPLIEALLPAARGLVKRGVLKTASGREVGTIRTSTDYEAVLQRLSPTEAAPRAVAAGGR